jgi:hypothetical protein
MTPNGMDFLKKYEDERLKHPSMQYYKEVYKDSRRVTKFEGLEDKRVVVYLEQGIGDCIHFARYLPFLSTHKTYIHCPVELHPLFAAGIRETELIWETEFELLDKKDPNLPEHDCHILSLSLPYLLEGIGIERVYGSTHAAGFPYLRTTKTKDLGEFDGRTKIGICWEGSPRHPTNKARSVPLRFFQRLRRRYPNCVFIALQREIHDPNLLVDCENMELYGSKLEDFNDTAALIKAVDFIVTVDTSTAHLAGALNKKTYLLLSNASDGRFGDGLTTRWYPSVHIARNTTSVRSNEDGTVDLSDPILKKTLPNWESVFDILPVWTKN